MKKEQESGWRLLGKTTVQEKLDRDEIKILQKKGEVNKLKIKVKKAAIEMKKVEVHYSTGDRQELKVRKIFGKNSESEEISLEKGKGEIKKVIFWYAKKRWKGPKPFVILMGKE